MAQRSASDGPTRGPTSLYPLLLALGFQLVVIIGGLLVPGSIVAYPFSVNEGEPVTAIYAFPGGRFLFLGTLIFLSVGFVASVKAASRLAHRHAMVIVLAAAVPLVTSFVL